MRLITTMLLSALCMGLASRASADGTASVIVLGLRSVEGDDDVANSLTDALRDAVHEVPAWQVMERSVSMSQMSLAHGCDEIDAACLNDIAKGLTVELVVYGTLRRTSARSEYDYQLALSLFNANTGSIGATENDLLPRAEAEQPGGLAARARTLVQRLASGTAGAGGNLSIQVNTSRAEVHIDGQMVGQTQNGQLVIEGVPAGEHDLEIVAVGRGSYKQRVMVSGTGQTNVIASLPAGGSGDEDDAEPEEESAVSASDGAYGHKPKSLRWLGYTLIGVGGASLVGAVVSMIVIGNVNGDPIFKKYRAAAGAAVSDICAEADQGKMFGDGITTGLTAAQVTDVKGMCGTGGTFEVLQWVFLATAVVSGGIGTYLLVTAKDGEQAANDQPRFALSPSLGRRSLAIAATLRF